MYSLDFIIALLEEYIIHLGKKQFWGKYFYLYLYLSEERVKRNPTEY